MFWQAIVLSAALEGEKFAQELSRAKAVCDVAAQIVSNGRLMLDATKAADDIPGIIKYPLLTSKENA